MRQAGKDYAAMPARERSRLRDRLDAIAAAPSARHPGVVAMQGEPPGRFRLRQGAWRAVFVVATGGDVVVTGVGHRREVYDR